MIDWQHDPEMPAGGSQALEDMACAYWHSEVLFAALELGLFFHLEEAPLDLPGLARIAHCQEEPLGRLLPMLARLGLIGEEAHGWRNRPLASRHLVPGADEYMGDFLLYRRYLQPSWQGLAATVAGRALEPGLSAKDDYPTRNLYYVRALDQLARVKASEIAAKLAGVPWQGPVLDLGGGAGALCRALIRQRPTPATLFDLPEVVAAARTLYPDPADWQGIATLVGDFRSHDFSDSSRFGLILMANFLHTYDEAEARACLTKAVSLLTAGGYLLIHDYFPDRTPGKGQLYDLNMMLNTARGHCHEARVLCGWLIDCGLHAPRVMDLASDSSIIIAQSPPC